MPVIFIDFQLESFQCWWEIEFSAIKERKTRHRLSTYPFHFKELAFLCAMNLVKCNSAKCFSSFSSNFNSWQSFIFFSCSGAVMLAGKLMEPNISCFKPRLWILPNSFQCVAVERIILSYRRIQYYETDSKIRSTGVGSALSRTVTACLYKKGSITRMAER